MVASAPAHAAPPSAQCVRHRWTDDALHVLDAQGEHTLFTLSLRAWGRGEDLVLAGTPRVSWNGSRRALDRDGIVEWYEIGGDAIEHGFTLLRPPESACETGAAVRLQLAVDAQLDVEVAAQGCDAVFRASDGITIYYEGLVAWDVTGSAVDARLERTEAGLAILVDDRVAVYPITVDPWIVVQEAKFTGGGPTSIAFGFDVDVSAEAVLVGAPSADPGGLINAGEARIFERAAGAWSLTAALRPSDAAAGDAFGFGLSIGADTAVVGAQGDDNQQGANAGAVYVFERIGGVWQEQEKLVASDLVADDFFGQHVALDGDTLAVSAPGQAPGSLGASGAVYVYVRSAGTWTLQTKFGSPPWATDLGDSLALHGDVLVAGAPDSSPEFVTGAGTAYVYRRTGTEWGAPFELRADVLGVGHAFGRSVAVHGDVVAVSARSESAVYVFRPVGGAWIKEAKLGSVAPTGASGLGSSVDVEGDRIVAANTSPHAPGANFAGEAYLFRRGPLGWTQQARFRASDPVPSLMLGNSIALSGDTVVAGTNRDSAYVFRVEQTSGFCFGDGSLATACPCAPPDFVPVPSGGARSGCASALSAAGARLEVGGLVSPDTLGFVAEIGAGYGGFALLVKSDARDLAGIASGDGVRCVDGNMIRFGGHFAGAHEALGTWTYPNSVQSTAVGVATLQAPGQTAYYQLLYRHAAPGFCSPGTTNWSNAVHIDW
ncbi:MAG: FG-GAP repeat protein [Planctomycetota bacterium]